MDAETERERETHESGREKERMKRLEDVHTSVICNFRKKEQVCMIRDIQGV